MLELTLKSRVHPSKNGGASPNTWMAEFRFRGKPYRFVVNARTGKTRGERPYSYLKIVLAALLGAAAAGGLLFVLAETGVLEQLLESSTNLN